MIKKVVTMFKENEDGLKMLTDEGVRLMEQRTHERGKVWLDHHKYAGYYSLICLNCEENMGAEYVKRKAKLWIKNHAEDTNKTRVKPEIECPHCGQEVVI